MGEDVLENKLLPELKTLVNFSICLENLPMLMMKALLKHNFHIYLFQCIIHQQDLFTNNINTSKRMEIVIKIITNIFRVNEN